MQTLNAYFLNRCAVFSVEPLYIGIYRINDSVRDSSCLNENAFI